MQDRYVGDVGDFGKYGLLRTLGPGFSFYGVTIGVHVGSQAARQSYRIGDLASLCGFLVRTAGFEPARGLRLSGF
jgi:hypothetical protein